MLLIDSNKFYTFFLLYIKDEVIILNSSNITIGIDNRHWETTSGGVRIAATTNMININTLRNFFKKLGVTKLN